MLCARCRRPLYSKLSDLCNPCAAARTLEEEVAAPWEDEKLRVIAGDIAVSAVRQVRALRLHRPSKAPEVTSKSAPVRPPLARNPGPQRRERSRSAQRRDRGALRPKSPEKPALAEKRLRRSPDEPKKRVLSIREESSVLPLILITPRVRVKLQLRGVLRRRRRK